VANPKAHREEGGREVRVGEVEGEVREVEGRRK
jgi:hypothetical protein